MNHRDGEEPHKTQLRTERGDRRLRQGQRAPYTLGLGEAKWYGTTWVLGRPGRSPGGPGRTVHLRPLAGPGSTVHPRASGPGGSTVQLGLLARRYRTCRTSRGTNTPVHLGQCHTTWGGPDCRTRRLYGDLLGAHWDCSTRHWEGLAVLCHTEVVGRP